MIPERSEQIDNLVVSAQNGDVEAMGELYEIFYEPISRFVRTKVDPEHSEDIVSDIFFRCVEQLNKYKKREGISFSSWLFRIAHNIVIDFYRKKREILGLDIQQIEENLTSFPSPQEKIMENESFSFIQTLLLTLTPAQKEILELKYFHDFSNEEISHITGKSEGNIRIIHFRALIYLRKKFPNLISESMF